MSDLVLEPALDHKGRHLEPAAEGTGKPDTLVLARSPATMMPATQLLIPGPREQAQAQDRDTVLIVKDWVRRGAIPGILELDFGDTSLKAYAKILPALRLCQLLDIPDQAILDILVKTDIQGRCTVREILPARRPDHPVHQRPPLETNSLWN